MAKSTDTSFIKTSIKLNILASSKTGTLSLGSQTKMKMKNYMSKKQPALPIHEKLMSHLLSLVDIKPSTTG